MAERPAEWGRNAVLITRPEPGASATAARVAALGFEPVIAPVTAAAPVQAHLPEPANIAAILVTSGNAIQAFSAAWHGTPLFSVGDATAARAADAGFRGVASARGDAVALAALVRRRLTPANGTLLLASGRGQGMALAEDLRGGGFRVIRRVVYAMAPREALPATAVTALRAGQVQVALFFSAETARHFVTLVQRAGIIETIIGLDAISIGRSTEMALRPLPWRRIRVAPKPDQDTMLALLR